MGPSAEKKGKVHFSRDDREIARRLRDCQDTKAIAGGLELAVATVNTHIRDMCEKVQVANRIQLIRWIWQNPECLDPGRWSEAGLHIQPCSCGRLGCLGGVAAELAAAE